MAPLGPGLIAAFSAAALAATLGACDPTAGVQGGGTKPAAATPTTTPAQPAPAQPADTKPSAADKPEYIEIKLGPKGKKKTFKLELALTPEKRFKGLSGRESIPENEGLLFVFPDDQVAVQNFVMRDCPVAIDIIFLDKTGSITAFYTMSPEDARKPGETEQAYESRLKRYSSRYSAQYVIELKGSQIREWDLKNGQKIEFDTAAVKKKAH